MLFRSRWILSFIYRYAQESTTNYINNARFYLLCFMFNIHMFNIKSIMFNISYAYIFNIAYPIINIRIMIYNSMDYPLILSSIFYICVIIAAHIDRTAAAMINIRNRIYLSSSESFNLNIL